MLVAVLATGAIAVLKWWTLDMPANWDESWAVIPGAITLRDNGFDIPALLSSPGYNQYGPATHGASPVTWMSGLVLSVVPSESALRALHFVHFAIGGFSVSEVYRFVRGVWSRSASGLFAGSMILVPVISAQLGAVYLEIPLMAATLLMANAYVRRRYWAAAGWATLATAIKPTGLYAAIAIGIAGLLTRFSWRSIGRGFLLGAPAIGIALWHLLEITQTYGEVPAPFKSVLSAVGTTGTMPEFSLPLLLSVLAFVAVRRSISEELRIRLRIAIAVELAFIFVFVIVPFVGLRDRLLPRYVVGILPLVAFVAIAAIKTVYGRRFAVIFSSLLLAFLILNTNGDLSPRRDVLNTVLQERTNAYADLILLQKELMDIGIARPEPVFVTAPTYWFRVRYPELGYSDVIPEKIVDLGHVDFDPDDPDTYPDAFLILETENYENNTKLFAESVKENDDFEVEAIERSRGRYTLELLVVRRVGDP